MRSVALMYHDVLAQDAPSGFETPGADGYKLSVDRFERHLDAIDALGRTAPSTRLSQEGLRLTFDDGGASALSIIADRLEARGWRGFFFVTTSMIGTPGFLTRDGVSELAARGHVVGSHSHTHPLQMARLSPSDIRFEWVQSREALEEILGAAVTVASIPGGMYSPQVARAAEAAGVRDLFTSEPRRRSWRVGTLRLHGRYSVKRETPATWAAEVAAGARLPRWRQRLAWETKKTAKRVLGRFYIHLRNRLN